MADPSLRTLVERLLPALHESAPCSITPSGAYTLLPVTTRIRTFLVIRPLDQLALFSLFFLLFLYFPSFKHLKGHLAAETWSPDSSAFGVGSWAKQSPRIGAFGGLGVRDPRPRIGIVICLFCFICSCYGARPILAVTTCLCPTLGAAWSH